MFRRALASVVLVVAHAAIWVFNIFENRSLRSAA
jgi:hypothetical protein